MSKELRCDIISVTSNTAVVVQQQERPAIPQECGHHELARWAPGLLGGLSHLEGQTANILSDANVETTEKWFRMPSRWNHRGCLQYIGLPITTVEFETLDIKH